MHWHAFAWSGSEVPPDSLCRDVGAAVMPRELAAWFAKPASLHKGAHTSADTAHAWIADELHGTVDISGRAVTPDVERAGVDLRLGQDAYVGIYTGGGFHVRALLTCPRSGADPRPVRCPGPPA